VGSYLHCMNVNKKIEKVLKDFVTGVQKKVS
jgi:hypothetical protein